MYALIDADCGAMMENYRREIAQKIFNELVPENEVLFIFNYLNKQIEMNEYLTRREPQQQELFEEEEI